MSTIPARIVIATLGSFGDLHPFLALGIALKARGHHVRIASFAIYRETIESHGLEFALMRPEAPEEAVMNGHFMHPLKGPKRIFAEWISPAIAESYEDLRQACLGADLLVSQALALAAPMVVETTGIPWASAILQPFAMFSAYDPPTMPPVPFLRGAQPWALAVNQHIHRYAQRWTERWIEPVRDFRQTLGLDPGRHPIYDGQHAPSLVLALFSSLMGRPQPDWPARTVQTGALIYDPEDALPVEVEDFLKRGEAPLVFTLGSAACFGGGRFFTESIRVAESLERRALFLTGMRATHALPESLPPWAARFDYAPYGKVFPHAAAIIHSGGIGTIMQALRAGKPQLVVPFAHDQPDNAARIARLGTGLSLPIKRYNRHRATRALQRLLTEPSFLARAKTLGDEACREQGADQACRALEALLSLRAQHG